MCAQKATSWNVPVTRFKAKISAATIEITVIVLEKMKLEGALERRPALAESRALGTALSGRTGLRWGRLSDVAC